MVQVGQSDEYETYALQGWKFIRKLVDALKKQWVIVDRISSKIILDSQSSVVQVQEKSLEKHTDRMKYISDSRRS